MVIWSLMSAFRMKELLWDPSSVMIKKLTGSQIASIKSIIGALKIINATKN